MNLLVGGGGGREHAIIKKLRENPEVETVYALPGNGGIAADAVCVPEIGAKDIDAIVAFPHNYGCSQLGNDHENTRKILRDMVKHPNAGAVLVVGLGCENNSLLD